jgi:hypothetical protein
MEFSLRKRGVERERGDVLKNNREGWMMDCVTRIALVVNLDGRYGPVPKIASYVKIES